MLFIMEFYFSLVQGYKDLAETAMREGDPLFRLIMNKYQAHRCITEGMDQGKADLLMKQ